MTPEKVSVLFLGPAPRRAVRPIKREGDKSETFNAPGFGTGTQMWARSFFMFQKWGKPNTRAGRMCSDFLQCELKPNPVTHA